MGKRRPLVELILIEKSLSLGLSLTAPLERVGTAGDTVDQGVSSKGRKKKNNRGERRDLN